MEQIKKLIKRTELELEKTNQSIKIVGNRPHFPMLVIFNEVFTASDYDDIQQKLSRVWFQSMQNIAFYKYSITSSNQLGFYNLIDNAELTKKSVMDRLDEVRMARDVFESMKQMFVYNVVNTSEFESVDEFVQHYNIKQSVKEIVADACKLMLVVLLDDSSAKRTVSNEIREFLSKHSEYDSTIIISNRTRDNVMYKMDELNRIVANLFILSNNDSISNIDDMDYNRRVATLYNNSTYILSYILRERPNKKIGIQISNSILENAIDNIKPIEEYEFSEWNKRLGITNGKLTVCEDFISNLPCSVDQNIFAYLPMRDNAVEANLDFSNMPYSKFKNYIYDEVFNGFVASYCENQLMMDADVSDCVEKFKDYVKMRFSAAELCSISNVTADRLIDQLETGKADESLPIFGYFKDCVKNEVRSNLLYPSFKNVLIDLKNEAEVTVNHIKEVYSEYQKNIPLNAFENLGKIYHNITVNHFHTEQGHRDIQNIIAAGNNYDDIVEYIFECFYHIISSNKDLFALPFIEEWECRLDLAGAMIFKEINEVLTGGSDDMIRLYGNYPINKVLKVFMLHTSDANGENPTKLYQHLKDTFESDSLVQYFNTGYDDALEAITFIECSGANLII